MLALTMVDVEAELEHTRRGILIRDLEASTLLVRGPDRQTWLNGLVTCDLAPRKVGDAVFGLVVGKTGKIQAEVYLLLGADALRVCVLGPPERATQLAESLDRYLVMEDATIEVDAAPPRWMLALGARASEAAEAARANGAEAGLTRRGALSAAVIAAPADARDRVVAAMAEAAGPSSVATPEGWERVRVEQGIAERGVDYDDDAYPQEAALELDGVSFAKGCYLGQEAVFMLEKRGHVKRRLVQLEVHGDASVGDPITAPDGKEVGHVTSRIARASDTLALGYVKYKHARQDTELQVGPSKARVTPLLAVHPED